MFGIGVVLLGRLPRLARLTRLRGQALHDIANQKAGALIKTNHWGARVIGLGVAGE